MSRAASRAARGGDNRPGFPPGTPEANAAARTGAGTRPEARNASPRSVVPVKRWTSARRPECRGTQWGRPQGRPHFRRQRRCQTPGCAASASRKGCLTRRREGAKRRVRGEAAPIAAPRFAHRGIERPAANPTTFAHSYFATSRLRVRPSFFPFFTPGHEDAPPGRKLPRALLPSRSRIGRCERLRRRHGLFVPSY
jgi:hypothetical protein